MKGWFIGIGIFVALIIVWVFLPFVIVDAGERAVVLHLGKVDRVLDEGLHWVTPIIEDAEKMDVRTVKDEVAADSASKDLQNVHSVIALNYNLDPEGVGLLWQEVGKYYKTKIIDPEVQDAIKASTAKFTAEELITKRADVKEEIQRVLTESLVKKHILVTNVSIVDFSFSASFDKAIEAKVTAEQRALEAQNKLEQVKFEAQQMIEKAKAEAESVRLQARALRENVQFIELKKLEVQLQFAKKWNGVLPVNLYGSAPIPFLQIK